MRPGSYSSQNSGEDVTPNCSHSKTRNEHMTNTPTAEEQHCNAESARPRFYDVWLFIGALAGILVLTFCIGFFSSAFQ
jgi:hypothetical protein